MTNTPTVVHLVRHGEVHNPDHVVYADLPGFGLSERGFRQAEEAAAHLSDRPLTAIYASPLQRAMETAVVIAGPHGLTTSSVPDLTEWLLAQRWKGLPWDELTVSRPGELEAYLRTPLDLPFSPESVEELAVRMTTAIDGLVRRHLGGEIVVVSHQDPIQAARLTMLHRSIGSLNRDKPGHAEVFTLEVGAPSVEQSRFLPTEQELFPPPE